MSSILFDSWESPKKGIKRKAMKSEVELRKQRYPDPDGILYARASGAASLVPNRSMPQHDGSCVTN